MIDGTIVIPFAEFSNLPSWIRKFFLDRRIAQPPSALVYADYLDDSHDTQPLATIKNTSDHVALRGPRFWDFDGSKATHGPDGEPAVELLFGNLQSDLNLLDNLLTFEPQTLYEWLANIAIWEYVKNDITAIFYVIMSRYSLEQDSSIEEVNQVTELLELVTSQYANAVLMKKTDDTEKSVDLPNLQSKLLQIFSWKRSILELILNSEYEPRDLLRSYREVNNPLAILNAFRLIYQYDAASDNIRYSEVFEHADALVAPLYGGVDLVFALRYALNHGVQVVEEITGKKLVSDRHSIPIIPVLSKIGSRGVVRSTIANVGSTIQNLTSDWPTGNRERDRVRSELNIAHLDNPNILIVDDSLATGGSAEIFVDWMKDATQKPINVALRTVYANLRWSEHQNSIPVLMSADPLMQSPISRKMSSAAYSHGSRFMPDAMVGLMQLRTERTCRNFFEVQVVINRLYQEGVIQGVGFDLDETIIGRTITPEHRRKELNTTTFHVISRFFPGLSLHVYTEKLRQHMLEERTKARENSNHPIDMISIYSSFLSSLGTIDEFQIASLAFAMLEAELKTDMKYLKALDGVAELLSELRSKNIPYGIFSNSHYTPEQVTMFLKSVGLEEFFENIPILCSSINGIPLKPNPNAIKTLAQQLNLEPRRLAYIGNSFSMDVVGAIKSGAIAIQIPDENERTSRKTRNRSETFHEWLKQESNRLQ